MSKFVKHWFIGALWLVGSVALVAVLFLVMRSISMQQTAQTSAGDAGREPKFKQAAIDRTTAPDSPIATPTGTLEPTPTPLPTLTPYPPIAWEPAPPCVNEPWSVEQWLQHLKSIGNDPIAKQGLTSLLIRQVHPMSTLFKDIQLDSLQDLLATKDEDPNKIRIAQRDVAGLWLNVIDGRLNTLTEIELKDLPEIKTVGDFLAYLEKAINANDIPDTIQAAAAQLIAGQGIRKSMCANLVVSRQGNKLELPQWSGAGISVAEKAWSSEQKPSSLLLSNVIPALNYSKIAIESRAYETGGPIWLYDVNSGEFLDLIAEISETFKPENKEFEISFDPSYPWEVIGWHSDNEHILLGRNDAGVIVWVNLQNRTYRGFGLMALTGDSVYGDKASLQLTPDGNKALFTGRNDSKNESHLYLLDLDTGQLNTLFSTPADKGLLYYPRLSPTLDKIVYLVESGSPSTEMHYAIWLFDLNTQQHTEIVGGDLARTEPVWSPDGQKLAFAWKDSTYLPGKFSSPLEERWRGNIWVFSLAESQLTQLTFINGGARHPVWSLDGRLLAFATHDNQIGMAELAKPSLIWPITEALPWPIFSFSSMFFRP